MEESERKHGKSDSKEKKSTPGTCTPEPAQATTSAAAEGDETDVCSEKFDPMLALYSPTVTLPFPNALCLNNLAAYESALKGSRARGAKPENVERRRRKAMKGVADPERIERLKKLMVNNPVDPESSGAPRGRRKSKPCARAVLWGNSTDIFRNESGSESTSGPSRGSEASAPASLLPLTGSGIWPWLTWMRRTESLSWDRRSTMRRRSLLQGCLRS